MFRKDIWCGFCYSPLPGNKSTALLHGKRHFALAERNLERTCIATIFINILLLILESFISSHCQLFFKGSVIFILACNGSWTSVNWLSLCSVKAVYIHPWVDTKRGRKAEWDLQCLLRLPKGETSIVDFSLGF